MSNIFGPSYWPNTGGIPTYAASGNHGQIITGLRTWPEEQIAESDTANPGTYSYEQYPADSLIPTTNTPDSWYAVQDGNVRIYVLDAAWADGTTYLATTKATGALCASDPADCKGYQIDAAEHWAAGSAEMTWLKRDLAAQPAGTIKMAVFHYPLQSLNNTQQSDPYLQAALQPVLQQYGVSMAFNGHAHTYQRFVPNNGSLISYVTGGGGGTLQPVDGTNDTKGKCAAAVASEQVYALGLGSAGVIDCGQSAPPMTKNASGSYYVPNESAANVYNFLKVNVTGNVITVTPMNALDQPFDQQSYTVVNGVTTLSTGTVTPPTTTTTTTSSTTTTAPPPPPGVALVQSHPSSGATNQLASVAAGDKLILSVSQYTGAASHLTGVTDSAGDTWTKLGAAYSSGHNSEGELWWTDAKGGPTTVTVSGQAASIETEVQEYSGLEAGAPNAATVVAGASSTSPTTIPLTGPAGDLEVGFVASHGTAEQITLPGFVTSPLNTVATATSGSSIAAVTAGYEMPGTTSNLQATYAPTAQWWTGGLAYWQVAG